MNEIISNYKKEKIEDIDLTDYYLLYTGVGATNDSVLSKFAYSKLAETIIQVLKEINNKYKISNHGLNLDRILLEVNYAFNGDIKINKDVKNSKSKHFIGIKIKDESNGIYKEILSYDDFNEDEIITLEDDNTSMLKNLVLVKIKRELIYKRLTTFFFDIMTQTKQNSNNEY